MRDVLGGVVIPQDSQGNPQNSAFIPLHEDRKGCPVPTEHRLDKLGVGLHVNV